MNNLTVAKSIRLLPEEAEAVARLSEQMAASEATLMKQWIREGLRAQKTPHPTCCPARRSDLRKNTPQPQSIGLRRIWLIWGA